ncbi:MAG: hypothetical protein Ta2B_19580 [Termitinemataceae bacterium]|nr:MAG: hypothetical protein Ta2B_19580 [Termitinemataceae bacterium]
MCLSKIIAGSKFQDTKDPDFWKVWTGAEARTINWRTIANEWQRENHA